MEYEARLTIAISDRVVGSAPVVMANQRTAEKKVCVCVFFCGLSLCSSIQSRHHHHRIVVERSNLFIRNGGDRDLTVPNQCAVGRRTIINIMMATYRVVLARLKRQVGQSKACTNEPKRTHTHTLSAEVIRWAMLQIIWSVVWWPIVVLDCNSARYINVMLRESYTRETIATWRSNCIRAANKMCICWSLPTWWWRQGEFLVGITGMHWITNFVTVHESVVDTSSMDSLTLQLSKLFSFFWWGSGELMERSCF